MTEKKFEPFQFFFCFTNMDHSSHLYFYSQSRPMTGKHLDPALSLNEIAKSNVILRYTYHPSPRFLLYFFKEEKGLYIAYAETLL